MFGEIGTSNVEKIVDDNSLNVNQWPIRFYQDSLIIRRNIHLYFSTFFRFFCNLVSYSNYTGIGRTGSCIRINFLSCFVIARVGNCFQCCNFIFSSWSTQSCTESCSDCSNVWNFCISKIQKPKEKYPSFLGTCSSRINIFPCKTARVVCHMMTLLQI